MDPIYIEPDEKQEYYTEERCSILELLNKSDDRSQSIARARVRPGVTTAWHRLKETSECYYNIQGQGLAEVGGGMKQIMTMHSLIRIPANTPQRITNAGEKDLVFLCFCVPAFSLENYESLE